MHFNTIISSFSSSKKNSKAVLVLFLSLLFFQSTQAQQLRELVATEVQPDQTSIAVFAGYPDDAAIIISSSLTDLRFESNVEIIDNLSDPASGEYRLVIPPFRQNIRVNANGFRQLRINVAVTGPKDVKYYTIEPAEEEEDLIPTVFAIEPITASDANFFIDGQAVDIRTRVDLAPGVHQVRIEKQGWRTLTEEITVSEDQPAIRTYTLEQVQPQTVTITSTPTDAIIELNNSVRGTTDYQFFELPGDYFVRISKAGYKTVQQNITIAENQNNSFKFVLEEFGGQLNITTNPPNARVYMNNQLVNIVNGTATMIPGPYTLRVEANGYETHTETIVIIEDQTETRNIILNQIVGQLQFTIQPISADVVLRDNFGNIVRQWQGAQYIPSMPVGNYTVSSTALNHQPYSQNLTIFENQTTTIEARMTSISEAELAEQRRQAQLEADRRALAAAREEERRKEAAREKRASFFKRPTFGGMYFHYNLFELDGNAFSTNVDESQGFGLGFFKYKNYKTTSFDFVYNTYSMVSNTNLPDEIISYNLTAAYVPTLPIGPFLIGYGVGFDFTQYEVSDAASYYYTYDAFLAFQLSFMPKKWNIGFMIDNRRSWDIEVADVYNPWTQLKYSLILSFN
jgi:hypothetical protein